MKNNIKQSKMKGRNESVMSNRCGVQNRSLQPTLQKKS